MGETAPKPVTKEPSAHWPQWSASAGELPAPGQFDKTGHSQC